MLSNQKSRCSARGARIARCAAIHSAGTSEMERRKSLVLFSPCQRAASMSGGLLQPSGIRTKSLGLVVLSFGGFVVVFLFGWGFFFGWVIFWIFFWTIWIEIVFLCSQQWKNCMMQSLEMCYNITKSRK